MFFASLQLLFCCQWLLQLRSLYLLSIFINRSDDHRFCRTLTHCPTIWARQVQNWLCKTT